jgi:Flp pilus assembly protein TadG
MARKSLLNATALKSDERGNVAMIGALAVLPILSVAGLALDLQITSTRKNEVQAIIDSAVLSGSKMKQSGASEEAIREHIKDYMETFIGTRSDTFSCADPEINSEDGTQDINATILCTQQTTLSQIFGRTKMDFTVASGTTYGIGKVEVAFVFDLSGSMDSNNRIGNLKAAAHEAVDSLLATLTENSEADDVRIAMVAYDDATNAGTFFQDVVGPSSSLTVTSSDTIERVCTRYRSNGTCRTWGYQTRSPAAPVSITVQPCVAERMGSKSLTDDAPGSGAYISRPLPVYDPYDDVWEYTGKWDGFSGCNTSPPLPLTSDGDDLHDYIDNMETGSGTAGHLGTAWGWYLLSPKWDSIWPSASEPLDYDAPDSKKAMILMTDGSFNTAYDFTNGNSAAQAQSLCTKAKQQGVIIYTVAFQAPQAGKDLLALCASDSGKAFTPEGAADLTEAYQTIASEISDLRLSY